MLLAAPLAWLAADLASGLVHWALDRFGSVHTPWVGAALIRPFREHHADVLAITRHDFVETNGASALGALPLLAAAHAPLPPAVCAFLAFAALGGLAANQCHQWAHTGAAQLPAPVRALQRLGIILPPERHAGHHRPPYDRDYCTASGWLNRPLNILLRKRA